MTTRVVCFVNRNLGADIALDLSKRREVDLVAVVSNDSPDVDLDLGQVSLEVPVTCWSDFVSNLDKHPESYDCGVSALFRHYMPPRVLASFTRGVVNLHPSFLPYGQGSYPATWAIWEQTPFGASAHLMTEIIDAGPILAQRAVSVDSSDTSATLYDRAIDALREIYSKDVVAWLAGCPVNWRDQPTGGSRHATKDLKELAHLDRATLRLEDRERLVRALDIEPTKSGVGMCWDA